MRQAAAFERSPSGGICRPTTALASSAELMCGAITPSAPPSSTRATWSGVLRRHAHERRDPDLERSHADLPGVSSEEARMLEVDIERVEAGGARNAGDLDVADEPHGHRRDHLVARELLLDVVAQDVADLHGPSPWPLIASGLGVMLRRPYRAANGGMASTDARDYP